MSVLQLVELWYKPRLDWYDGLEFLLFEPIRERTMTPLVEKAMALITSDINLKTGLAHPNDKNKTKELLCRLRDAGETLDWREIEQWARSKGWRDQDARELGKLVAQIAGGDQLRSEETDDVLNLATRWPRPTRA